MHWLQALFCRAVVSVTESGSFMSRLSGETCSCLHQTQEPSCTWTLSSDGPGFCICLKNLLVQIYRCRLNDMISYWKKYKSMWVRVLAQKMSVCMGQTRPAATSLTYLTWVMAAIYALKLFYHLTNMLTPFLLLNNNKHVLPLVRFFSSEARTGKTRFACVCISVRLSPSLGLRSHPPRSVLFSFVIFLCFFSLLHILTWLDCCAKKEKVWPQFCTGICHRGTTVIMWHLHDGEAILTHFCHWYEWINMKVCVMVEENGWRLQVKPYLVSKSEIKLCV